MNKIISIDIAWCNMCHIADWDTRHLSSDFNCTYTGIFQQCLKFMPQLLQRYMDAWDLHLFHDSLPYFLCYGRVEPPL